MLLKRKIIPLLLTVILMITTIPVSVFAGPEDSNITWAGAMNYNSANNYITTISSLSAPNRTEMKWAYPLNISAMSGGAYYAGQSVIADGYLYATGGGKLHKIDVKTGEGVILNNNAGSTGSDYDYLCYADGILLLSTKDSIVAYDLYGTQLGSVEGTYGDYHPIQYHDGYAICNGWIYQVEQGEAGVTFTQVGETAIGGDTFNWSSGAFVEGVFYVAATTTVYAVDYKTNTILDSYVFDPNRTATKNVQGGLCYDEESGRLFWATYTYNSYLHSIAIESGKFVENSYMSEDVGQKSVATPIVYNGRVYLAGQQGRICVHGAEDLSKVYDSVSLGGGKVQGTPILSAADGKIRIYAQCSNGHLYLFTDHGDLGEAVKLAETQNYTKVLYPYAGYEQYAMDEEGNIYCYNESGYLFCFGRSGCEKPTITTDLSEKQVKYGVGTPTEALTVAATVSEGELSYQWQSGSDGESFSDIAGATEASYLPPSDVEGKTYYRCVITNTLGKETASETSSAACILIKTLSSSTLLNAMAGKGNSATATSNIAKAITGEDGVLTIENCTFDVKNLFFGVSEEGNVTGIEVLYGAGTATPKRYSVSNDTYPVRYYQSTYTKPIVAKVSVTAEDGVSTGEQYLIVSKEDAKKYILRAELTSESEYFSQNSLVFTQADQSAALLVDPKETIGTGELYQPQWTWESSDVSVARVDANGVVTCVGGGEATITATHQGIQTSIHVSSDAPVHNLHTYQDKLCSVCGYQEPEAISAKMTVIDPENNIAVSKDGTTELYQKELSVGDPDCDGKITLQDALIAVHQQHSVNGTADFATEESDLGPFITKFWGQQTSNVCYLLNDAVAYSLLTEWKPDDRITTYFYRDTQNYSDIYTWLDGNSTITAGVNAEFVLKGLASSGTVIPKGATIQVFDKQGSQICDALAGDDGSFVLCIQTPGEYVLKAGGNASYTGQVWDSETGGYRDQEFFTAPVVTSQLSISVLPYVEKTVYMTIATKNGGFGVNKNGEDMWRVPVKVTDDPENPDGVVTILEALIAAHQQYHPNGAEGFYMESSKYGAFITKLWGENNGGNCQYYFNDVEMTGSGIKTGTNGREWKDQLLDTVVETGDAFYIYSLQATDYNKADLYTYFDSVSQNTTAGNEMTFTLKSVAGYGNNKVETSLVTVKDDNGKSLPNLSTTVDADGTFKITFSQKGTYTVDVRTNGGNYIAPARLIVYVKGSGSSSDTITVSFTLLGDEKHGTPAGSSSTHTKKKGNLETWLKKTKITLDKGSYVIDAVEKALKDNGIGYVIEDNYVSEVKGLGEFDNGELSGWLYTLNGKYPTKGMEAQKLSNGDAIVLHYTDDYTAEKASENLGTSSSTVIIKPQEPTKTEDPTESDKLMFTPQTYPDVRPEDWYYEGVKYAYENHLMQGTENGFEPESNMTRAMLVTVLWRMEQEPVVNYLLSFDDVIGETWYTEAVRWAASEKIILGVDTHLFGTEEELTREQLAIILYRYAQKKNLTIEKNGSTDMSAFSDFNSVADYATGAMKWAVGSGLIQGKNETILAPADSATRAEIATIFMRFSKGIGK